MHSFRTLARASVRGRKSAPRTSALLSGARRSRFFSSSSAATKAPVKVAVTGAAGNIGYALLFRIASGALLGPDQPVIIHGIELPQALNALKGVAMELDDCAFPLLQGIRQTSSLEEGFEDVDVAMLVGSKPRGPGMDRADLMRDNGKIFEITGKALNKTAKRTCRTIVVGNPANTNCLIASAHAPDIPAANFTAMTRLDHNRALSQLKTKTGCQLSEIEKLCIWGNHSNTQYPDLSHTTISGKAARDVIGDDAWITESFIPDVQVRGGAIIAARGQSSAASAGSAAIDHIHDWVKGTNGQWTSMAVPSDGSYGVPEGVFFSYPVTCADGKYEIVQGLDISAESAERIEATKKELFEEREMVRHLL